MNREMLEDIFVTALEGGSNYWYLITSETSKKIRSVVPKSVDPYFSTAILTAILEHDIEVEVHDAENPDEVLGILSTARMEERLRELNVNESYRWALELHEKEEGDGDSADVVFQFLVLGDVWFG